MIQGYDINASGDGNAIFIANTTSYLEVRDCHLNDARSINGSRYEIGSAIYVNNVSNIKIENNVCNDSWAGVIVTGSCGIMVINNTCTNDTIGILMGSFYLGSVYLDCNDNIVSDNDCAGSFIGIQELVPGGRGDHDIISSDDCNGCYLGGIILNSLNGDCSYNAVMNDNCSYDYGYGIELTVADNNSISNDTCIDSRYGIAMFASGHNDITGDVLSGDEQGIYLCEGPVGSDKELGSDHNTVFNNTISTSASYGIYISDSDVNSVYGNVFVDNDVAWTSSSGLGPAQAYDNGTNIWNSTSYGNYWSDWQGPGNESTGIVELPYMIDGGNDRDLMPVAMDLVVGSPTSPDRTNISTLAVSGTASDGFGIGSIIWSNEATGVSGDCSGTSSWSANIGLIEGENNITVTEKDALGHTKTGNMTVLCTAAPLIIGLSPNGYNARSIPA